jgi:hypothetical protein
MGCVEWVENKAMSVQPQRLPTKIQFWVLDKEGYVIARLDEMKDVVNTSIIKRTYDGKWAKILKLRVTKSQFPNVIAFLGEEQRW